MTDRAKLLRAAHCKALEIAQFTGTALDELSVGERAAATRAIDSALCRIKPLERDLVAAQIAVVSHAK